MHTVWIALVIAGIVGLGIWLAVSDLTQQYALDTSGSLASTATCSLEPAVARRNEAITVRLFGIPESAPVAWSTPEGIGRVTSTGAFSVTFPTVGTKTVSAFLFEGVRWSRVPCTITVQ